MRVYLGHSRASGPISQNSHLWFVDPPARGLEAFEPRDGQWLLIASLKDTAAVSVPPFEAITFNLADL